MAPETVCIENALGITFFKGTKCKIIPKPNLVENGDVTLSPELLTNGTFYRFRKS